MTQLTIANETKLWMLWDRDYDWPEGSTPACSEGFLASMLGMDRIELRAAYEDYLKRHNATSAHDVRYREMDAILNERRARK